MGIFLGLLSFYGAFLISTIVLSVIINLLSALPLIGGLLEFFFRVRGDSPSMMIAVISGMVAFYACLLVIERISKNETNLNKNCKVVGTVLIAVNVVCFVLNLVYGNPIISNIVIVAAGLFIRNNS